NLSLFHNVWTNIPRCRRVSQTFRFCLRAKFELIIWQTHSLLKACTCPICEVITASKSYIHLKHFIDHFIKAEETSVHSGVCLGHTKHFHESAEEIFYIGSASSRAVIG